MQEKKKRKPLTEQHKENIRKATKGLKKTFKEPHPNWFQKGEIPETAWKKGNKSWNKGKFFSEERHRNKYKVWRKAVFDRDNRTCVKCGATEKLHAHHIIPWKEDETKRFDIDNGQTLCNSCHSKEEGISDEARCVEKIFRKGHKPSEETRRKISYANKGQIPWNKGTKGLMIAWNKGLKKNGND